MTEHRFENIGWTVGNHCNASCGHCYSWKVRKDSSEFLTTDGEPPWRAECECRKPAPGMLERAAEVFGIDLARSAVVGDLPSDIALAAAVGARSILVRTGFGEDQWTNHRHRFTVQPDLVTDDLWAAVDWLLSR